MVCPELVLPEPPQSGSEPESESLATDPTLLMRCVTKSEIVEEELNSQTRRCVLSSGAGGES